MKGITELLACLTVMGLCAWMIHTHDFHRHTDDAYRQSADAAYRSLAQLKSDVDGGATRQAYQQHLIAAHAAVTKLTEGHESATCLRRTYFLYDLAGREADMANSADTKQQEANSIRAVGQTGETAAASLDQAGAVLKAGE